MLSQTGKANHHDDFSPSGTAVETITSRRVTRQIHVGDVAIGGDAPIAVQSMTNTDTSDAESTLAQINALATAGCDIIRIAIPDDASSAKVSTIVRNSPIPIIADIHFRPDLAFRAIEAGVAGIRINPGTIGDRTALKSIACMAGNYGVAVRIGINAGSLEKTLRQSAGHHSKDLGKAMAHNAAHWCETFEDWGCHQLKVSLKSSSIPITIAAYKAFADISNIPTHLGLTEAGSLRSGRLKSAVAIGSLLLDGIGDTIRVSLTGDPLPEIETAYAILEATERRERRRPDVISCPTCGRTKIDLLPLVEAVENEIDSLLAAGLVIPYTKIAIMGCVVNGPGEARDADIGIAGGPDGGVIFKAGKVVGKLPENELAATLIRELRLVAKAKPPRV